MKKEVGTKTVSKNHPIVQKKINKSLKESVVEGSYASVSTSLGVSYFTPFALALNSTASQIGILSAFVNLIPGLTQLKSAHLIQKYSRKKIAVMGAILQNLIFIPIILIGILFYFNLPHTPWIFIGLVGLFFAFGAISHPAWFSWMGSLVPEEKRGKYFAKRNRIMGLVGLIAMVIGALILEWFKKTGIVLIGFGVLFALAFLFRIMSILLLKKQYEPRLKIRKKDYFSFKSFLKNLKETPFGRFSIFSSIMLLASNIAMPFWAVYILKDLSFSYIWFMLITVSGIVFQFLFFPVIGKISDKYGNINLLKICLALLSLSPFLIVISEYLPLKDISLLLYFIFFVQLISGFVWAGFFLATNNYIYDSIRVEKRSFGLTYYNLLNGLGLFVGALIGSGLTLLNLSFMNVLLFIFLVSGILRFLVYFIGINKLREVRHVKKMNLPLVIKELNPSEIISKEIHEIEHTFSKVEHYI